MADIVALTLKSRHRYGAQAAEKCTYCLDLGDYHGR